MKMASYVRLKKSYAPFSSSCLDEKVEKIYNRLQLEETAGLECAAPFSLY